MAISIARLSAISSSSHCPAGLLAAQIDLGGGQVADSAQHVVQLVAAARSSPVGQVLQVQLDIGQHAGIEQLAQLLGAEQVAQQVAVERQSSGPPFGERRVALVHVGGDPVEQQALGHRAGSRRIDADDAHGATAQLAEDVAQRRDVEDVLEALPRRLEEDGERRVLGGDGEQVSRLLALLPQRRALVRPASRQQQRTAGALTEPRREQRRLRQRGDDQLLDVLGLDEHRFERQLVGGLRQAQHDAVVTPHGFDRQVVLVTQATLDGHRPRCVDGRAEGAEDADPPVADLVPESFDDDRTVVGDDAGGLGLLGDVLQEVRRRELVEGVVAAEALRRLVGLELAQLAYERAESTSELEWPTRPVAVPERHLPRLAGSRSDRDPFERDVLDAPRRRAQEERLPRPALVHHLLVELADTGAVGEEDTEQPPIRDGSARRDGQSLGPVARANRVAGPVPHDAGAQLGELLARVAAGQQIERVGELLVGQLGEVGRPPDQRSELGDRSLAAGGGVGDDLLGEDVERVAEVAGRLDLPVEHAPGDHCGLQQVAAVLGVDRAPARLADLVARPSDALQASAHGPRRLDLDHEIDGSHVDAELEAARGDDRPEVAALELVLDDDALLAGERTVVRLDEVLVAPAGLGVDSDAALLGELVELGGESLSQSAGVAEDDRRPVLEHLVEDARVHARPDRGDAGRFAGRVRGGRVRRCGAQVAHVLDRDDHLDIERLADAGVDDGDGAWLVGRVVSAEEARHLLEWTLGCRQADALRGAVRELLQALQRQGEVSPALGRRERVDLVDDDRLDTDERLRRR